MRKLLYIFTTLIGLTLAACDLIDPTPGNQTDTPQTPQGPEQPEGPKELSCSSPTTSTAR